MESRQLYMVSQGWHSHNYAVYSRFLSVVKIKIKGKLEIFFEFNGQATIHISLKFSVRVKAEILQTYPQSLDRRMQCSNKTRF